jgi:sugar/nucleoside kinase (ribokinase family)
MSAQQKKGVLAAGIAVADVVARPFSQLPEPGSLGLIEQIGLYSGGCAANTALSLARLGVPVDVLACVGSDEFGDFVVRTLQRGGVGASAVVRAPNCQTSSTVVLVSADGERSFLHCIGASAALRPEQFPGELLSRYRILHLGGALLLPGFDGAPMAAVLGRARSLGLLTTLDTAYDRTGRWIDTLGPCLPGLDVLMADRHEAAALSGSHNPEAMADFFLARGARQVAIKLGPDGCLLKSAGERHCLPAFDVPVVDTTGAGDAFAAGFLAGLYAGLGLRECGLLGCACGARCVGFPGAASFPLSLDWLREKLAGLGDFSALHDSIA